MIESSQIVSSAVRLVPLQADFGADSAAHRGLGRVTTHLEIIGFFWKLFYSIRKTV
jgi:hypothetical protein